MRRSVITLMMLVIAASAMASQELQRPQAVSPEGFASDDFAIPHKLVLETPIYMDRSILSDLFLDGGDRLTALQNNDGGWDWPLTDGDPGSVSPLNTLGPIAKGLARAYVRTSDATHLSALTDAGTLLLTKTNNFSPSDGYLAAQLDVVFGGSAYTTHVMNNFYTPLANGTYDRLGLGTLYSTASYVQLIRDDRASQGIPNLAAWDVGMGLIGAVSAGAGTSAWIAGTEAEINELDGDAYYDVIGLAGALYGLAFAGESFDPTAGEHAAAANLGDLADILASYQIAGGGFAWNSNWVIPNDGDETIQETAYAILALNELGRAEYLTNIYGAGDYMESVQLVSGGWENYVGSGENNEVTAEALWGLDTAYSEVTQVWVDDNYNSSTPGWGITHFATIQAGIDAVTGSIVNVAAGTYAERLLLDEEIDLRGAQYGVDPTPGGARVTPAAESIITEAGLSTPNPDVLVEIAAAGAGSSINGFTLVGDPTNPTADTSTIRCWANSVVISKNIIDGRSAVLYKGADNLDVLYNRITANKAGVIAQPNATTNLTVTGNRIVRGSTPQGDETGLYMTAVTTALVSDNTITGFLTGRAHQGSNLTAVTIDGNVFTGNKDGISYFGGATFITITDNTLSNNTRYGIGIKGQDISIGGNVIANNGDTGIFIDRHVIDTERVTATGNEIYGNTNYGVWVNTALVAETVDATDCWWGSTSGPYHPTLNPSGTGNDVSDQVDFDPWRGAADLSVLPASNGPINCSQSVTLDFDYTPDPPYTPAMRGFSVTVGASAHLSFGEIDIAEGELLDGTGNPNYFDVVENGDGTFDVHGGILGPTDGIETAGTLFTVTFHGAATGTGEARIEDYILRDLVNADFFATTNDAQVLVDCTAPAIPVMTAEPTYTQGLCNQVFWSDESGSGAVLYYAEVATDVGFGTIVGNSGWIAGTDHTFCSLSDATLYYYRVKDKDALNNESGWSNIVSSTQDDTDPVSSVDALAAYQNTVPFNVAFTASDATSGVNAVQLFYSFNGGLYVSFGSQASSPFSFTAPSGNGQYCFYTVATDNVGNVETVPGSPDQCTIVDTMNPAGTFVINNGAVYTNTLAVNLDSNVSDTNGPLSMRFSNDNATWPEGWVAYAAVHAWTLAAGADGVRTVYAEYRDAAMNVLQLNDTIIYDSTAPGAVSGINAAPGHQKVTVTWTDPGDGDLASFEIWRGMWYDLDGVPSSSAYPEYDDLSDDVIPTRPASRAAAAASSEWVLAGTAAPGAGAFVDSWPSPRGVYYYEVFAKDVAGNYGAPAAANDRATNYWLGDLPVYVDGYVTASDVTVLAAAYGTVHGGGFYNNECDIGPTEDHSGYSIPATDNIIGFEDLMIISLTYGFVGPVAPVEGTEFAHLTWYRVDEFRWALGLLEPCRDLKGLRLTATLPEGVSATVAPSSLLMQQDGPHFLLNVNGLDISLAMLGQNAPITGEGELFRVTLSADVMPGAPDLLCRSSANDDLEFILEATAIEEIPASYRLAGNFPNPFNPKTTIRFDLVEGQAVKLAVFDAEGRKVTTLVDAFLPAGYHTAVWDGRDAAGQAVSTGVYFYRIEAGPLHETAKMLLLK